MEHKLAFKKLTNGTIQLGDASGFWPIDGQLLGNKDLYQDIANPQGENGLENDSLEQNQLFTYEVKAEFVYQGDEEISIMCDDGCFVYINDRLALDHSGIHMVAARKLTKLVDAMGEKLEMKKGRKYPIHIFFSDRMMVDSHLILTIKGMKFVNCEKMLPKVD